jgi:hypothetical protein
MLDRIMRAIRLDATLYREVAADSQRTGEAVLVIVIATFLSAIGSAIGTSRPLLSFVAELANSLLLGWLLWAVVAYAVGTMLGGKSGIPPMARALAFASAPRFLALLGFIPCIGWLFRLAAWLLVLVAGVIAIREAMGFDTLKAVVTAVLGLAVYIVVAIVLAVLFGGMNVLGRSLLR